MKVWRFLGFDDGFGYGEAYLVGCVTAGTYVEGFMVGKIEIDGLDVTDRIIELVNSSKFRIQLKCIFLDGLTFAGFNVADIVKIHDETGIPVIVVMRKMPDMDRIRDALMNLKDFERRIRIIENAGAIEKIEGLFVQIAGCDVEDARIFIRASKLKGKIPEALRIAHLVASALIHGESKKF